MAAIVRIKRRRNEDPQDLLLISCKKPKPDTDRNTDTDLKQKTLFKFAGTVNSKDEAVSKPVREAIRKQKLEKEFKQHQENLYGELRQQTRQEHRQSTKTSRYKVISRHRVLNLDSLDEIDDKVDESVEQERISQPKELSSPTDDRNVTTCKIGVKNIDPLEQTESSCTKRNEKDTVDNNRTGGNEHDSATEAGSSLKAYDKTLVKECSESSSSDAATCNEIGQKIYCLLDVESEMPTYQSVINQSTTDQITCNSQPMRKELVSERGSDEDYVYDLYFVNNRDFDFRLLERDLTFEAYSENYLYTGGLSDNEDDFVYDDEDDENDENNWRNDYPDEDPEYYEHIDDDAEYGEGFQEVNAFESGQDNQLAEWMSWRCNIEDDNELSSDEDAVERYEAGPRSSDAYYRYVRELADNAGSDSETDLPYL